MVVAGGLSFEVLVVRTYCSIAPFWESAAFFTRDVVVVFFFGDFRSALAASASSQATTADGAALLAKSSKTQAKSGLVTSKTFSVAVFAEESNPSSGASKSSSLFRASPSRPDEIASSTSAARSMGTTSPGM